MNFFDHKDLGNHLEQLCPKVVKYPVYSENYAIQKFQQNLKWIIAEEMQVFGMKLDVKLNISALLFLL